MSQGLQCWDGNGTLVVDLGDYNMRYMGAVNLSVSAGTTTSWNVSFPGMKPNGWLAIMRTTQWWNDFYCIPGTNSFIVQYLPTRGIYSQTITFDVYSFDV